MRRVDWKVLDYWMVSLEDTEYARALLRSQSRDFILVEADKENSNRSERKISLLMAEKMAVETGRPILVDEAEIILNTQKDSSGFFLFGNAREEKDNPQKQWVNELHHLFWICMWVTQKNLYERHLRKQNGLSPFYLLMKQILC